MHKRVETPVFKKQELRIDIPVALAESVFQKAHLALNGSPVTFRNKQNFRKNQSPESGLTSPHHECLFDQFSAILQKYYRLAHERFPHSEQTKTLYRLLSKWGNNTETPSPSSVISFDMPAQLSNSELFCEICQELRAQIDGLEMRQLSELNEQATIIQRQEKTIETLATEISYLKAKFSPQIDTEAAYVEFINKTKSDIENLLDCGLPELSLNPRYQLSELSAAIRKVLGESARKMRRGSGPKNPAFECSLGDLAQVQVDLRRFEDQAVNSGLIKGDFQMGGKEFTVFIKEGDAGFVSPSSGYFQAIESLPQLLGFVTDRVELDLKIDKIIASLESEAYFTLSYPMRKQQLKDLIRLVAGQTQEINKLRDLSAVRPAESNCQGTKETEKLHADLTVRRLSKQLEANEKIVSKVRQSMCSIERSWMCRETRLFDWKKNSFTEQNCTEDAHCDLKFQIPARAMKEITNCLGNQILDKHIKLPYKMTERENSTSVNEARANRKQSILRF